MELGGNQGAIVEPGAVALTVVVIALFFLGGRKKGNSRARRSRAQDGSTPRRSLPVTIQPERRNSRAANQLEPAKRSYSYVARKPLHPIEQDLYWKLRLAIPSYSVLPQVAMSQIVQPVPNIYEAWNPIANKVVDFLVLKRDFTPLCVIELDGRHHQDQKQKQKDEKRDAALNMAGIPVIRWTPRNIPTGDEIAELIRQLESKLPKAATG